jgi:hypothetical protein
MTEANTKDAVATKSGRMRSASGRNRGVHPEALDGVESTLRDRILGAIWVLTKGVFRTTTLAEVKEHVRDLAAADVERAVVVLNLEGEIELKTAGEHTRIRLRPVLFGSLMGPLREGVEKVIGQVRGFASRSKKKAEKLASA